MPQYGVDSRIKKHAATESSQNTFVTRQKAIEYLQVTNAEFRKLCILKHITPRIPPKQYAGIATYYFKKDIVQLARDPVVETLRKLHTYKKKFNRFVFLGDKHSVKFLELQKPEYDMATLVKNRYPTPDAALADIDDCLSLIALFSSFSATVTGSNI